MKSETGLKCTEVFFERNPPKHLLRKIVESKQYLEGGQKQRGMLIIHTIRFVKITRDFFGRDFIYKIKYRDAGVGSKKLVAVVQRELWLNV